LSSINIVYTNRPGKQADKIAEDEVAGEGDPFGDDEDDVSDPSPPYWDAWQKYAWKRVKERDRVKLERQKSMALKRAQPKKKIYTAPPPHSDPARLLLTKMLAQRQQMLEKRKAEEQKRREENK